MASIVVLGSPRNVKKLDGSSYDLPDPLLSTILDFTRRALDQLARGLRVVVVHTRHKYRGSEAEFFEGKDGPADPSQDPSGCDVYYLLKNLERHNEAYAGYLGKPAYLLAKNVDYLLQTIRNHLAHQSYLGDENNSEFAGFNPKPSLRKYKTVDVCLHKCIELLGWFMNATEFYDDDVKMKARRIQLNLIDMRVVVKDHGKHKEAMESITGEKANDTHQAKDFLRRLLGYLEEEESRGHRPVTHAVNMILAPRIQEPSQRDQPPRTGDTGETSRCIIA